MSTDQLRKAALALPDDEKIKLAEDLMASLNSNDQLELDAEWPAEIEDRIDAYNAGKMTSRPADEVFRDIRDRLK